MDEWLVRVPERKPTEERIIRVQMPNGFSIVLTKPQALTIYAQLGIYLGDEDDESPETDSTEEEKESKEEITTEESFD